MKLYDKRYDFNFPIVNFPFIYSNIQAALVYKVYISLLVRYSELVVHNEEASGPMIPSD